MEKRKRLISPSIDRLPPNSQEAECGIIGSIILSPECVGECLTTIKTEEAFYDLRTRELYKSMVEMWTNDIPLDMITVCQWLKDRQKLEAVGGLAYIASLPDSVPSSANLSYYVEILNRKYELRKLIQICTDTVARVYEHEDAPVEPLVEEIQSTLQGAITLRISEPLKTIRELVHDSINRIEELHQLNGRLSGISSGFRDLDKLTGGFKPKQLTIIAARPSLGKTSIMLNIVTNALLEQKLSVGVFSLEMPSIDIVTRMICARAQVNLQNIGDGFLAERDFPKITGAAGKLANSLFQIDDTSGMTMTQIRRKSREMVAQHGIKMLLIDQLSEIKSGFQGMKREREVAYIAAESKEMAKELNIPVILLSQINREAEKEKNRRPRLSDLRESGDIEAKADLVGLLHKPDDDDENPDARPVDFILAKNRNGPTGTVHLLFLKCFTKFESAARIVDEPDYLPTQEPPETKSPYRDY